MRHKRKMKRTLIHHGTRSTVRAALTAPARPSRVEIRTFRERVLLFVRIEIILQRQHKKKQRGVPTVKLSARTLLQYVHYLRVVRHH